MQKNKMINENELVPYSKVDFPKGPYLVFAPHPDDETLGMGGTIALAVQKKTIVNVVFMTSGDMGGDPDIRIEETRQAAAILGVNKTFYLNLPDRKVYYKKLPESFLDEIIDTTQPNILFLPSFQEIHPDHRATTHKILSFLKKKNYHFELWFYEINRQGEINSLIDISSVINIKKQAIDCYSSQQKLLDYKSHSLCLNYARSITLGTDNTYVEGFWVDDGSSKKRAEDMYFDHVMKYFSKSLSYRLVFLCVGLALKTRFFIGRFITKSSYNRNKISDVNVKKNESIFKDHIVNSLPQPEHSATFTLIDMDQLPIARLYAFHEIQNGFADFSIHEEKETQNMGTVISIFLHHDIAFPMYVDRNDLACIKLFMATYQRINPGILLLTLYANENDITPVRTCEVMAASIVDNSFTSFTFDPIINSKDHTFFVVLSLKDGKNEFPLGLWTRPRLYKESIEDYHTWIKKNETECIIPQNKQSLSIAIILPVFDPNGNTLSINMIQESVESVINQNTIGCYWEFFLLDYKNECSEQVKKWAQLKQVSIINCDMVENLNVYFNKAIEISSADFFLSLYPYDMLAPNAIAELIYALNQYPDTNIFYSDEDKITETGVRIDPFFKPDWSPDLLLSLFIYPGSLIVFNKQLVQETGGFAKGFNECAEYDLMLRLAEKTDKIIHIPKILYHRRELQKDIPVKNISFSGFWNNREPKAVKRALEAAVIRGGGECKVCDGLIKNSFRISYSFNQNTVVSIIIPFKDYPELLETAVKSILDKTNYPNYEIICVNNQSQKPSTFALIDKLNAIPCVTVIHDNNIFNYSALNNKAVSHAKGSVLLFLNSDIKVITDNWLEFMLEHACRKEVGAVGGKLYYVNSTIQHAGIILGIAGLAGHAFKHIHMDDTEYYHGLSSVVRNVSGVTGACMMIRRSLFEEMEGFDEEDFKISYNDLDLCLRLQQQGYRIIYTPFAQLYHYESYSRGLDYDNVATQKICEKWGKTLEVDPFYNSNLTIIKEDWSLK